MDHLGLKTDLRKLFFSEDLNTCTVLEFPIFSGMEFHVYISMGKGILSK